MTGPSTEAAGPGAGASSAGAHPERIVACSVTAAGAALARRLPYEHHAGRLVATVRERWDEAGGFVLVCATYAALDRAAVAANRLGHMVLVAVSRGVPLGGSGALRLAAENPVFVCWGPAPESDPHSTGQERPPEPWA